MHQFFVGTALRLSNIIDLIDTTPQIRDEIIVFQCTVFIDTTRNAADLSVRLPEIVTIARQLLMS